MELLTKGGSIARRWSSNNCCVRFPRFSRFTSDGQLLGRKSRFPAARTAFEQTLQIQPDNGEALARLTILDLAAKRTTRRAGRIDARIAANPAAALLTLAARITPRRLTWWAPSGCCAND